MKNLKTNIRPSTNLDIPLAQWDCSLKLLLPQRGFEPIDFLNTINWNISRDEVYIKDL